MDLRDRVTLDPDPFWPERYEEERRRVLDASGGDLLGVFHVGSTAIRDLPGKPALDVVAVYEDERAMEAAAGRRAERDEYEREPGQLVFREYLRENADARREYARVKRAAAEHAEDVEAYTRATSEVVASILDRACEEGYYDRLPAFA